MKIKLPKLHVLLSTDKEQEENHEAKNVHVHNGYAIASGNVTAIVDLKEYIKKELNVSGEGEIQELDQIISWFNGKSFSSDFWKELTTPQFIKIDEANDVITIYHLTYVVNLNYSTIDCDIEDVVKSVNKKLEKEPVEMDRHALIGGALSDLFKAFGSEIKSDNLLLQTTGTGSEILFSLSSRTYIFGIIEDAMDSSMEIFAFENTKTFNQFTQF